jgi:hypothetical protein
MVVFWLRKKSDGCGEMRGITRIDDMVCEKKYSRRFGKNCL